ncbi:MAG: SpoIIE family protein phosphatase [Bacteroidia bacterium]|nr:SpoIIE family protein phosphatase [Bacteroidia bacterium]
MRKTILWAAWIALGWSFPCESCYEDILCLGRCAYQAMMEAHTKEAQYEATLLLAYSWLKGDFVEGVPRLLFSMLGDRAVSDSLRLHAMLFLAQAYYKLGRPDSAIIWYDRVIEQGQAHPFLKARAHLGVAALLAKRDLLRSLGHAAEASEIADHLQLSLLTAVAYSQLAYLTAEQRNLSTALQYAEKAVQAAQVALSQNLRHLLLTSPMEAYLAATANLASLYAETGRYKEAKSLYQRILSEAKNDKLALGQAVIGLASLYLQERSYKEVDRLLAAYRPLLSSLPYELRKEVLRLQAQLHIKLNQLAAALSTYEQLVEQAEAQVLQAQALRIEQLRILSGIEMQEARLRSIQNARQKERRLYFILGGVGFLVLIAFGLAAHTAKKRAAEERNFREIIATQSQKIQEQAHVLERQNAELVRVSEVLVETLATVQESYAAARRLQRAIMPDLEKLVPGSALYYQPMHEVGGDFCVFASDIRSARLLFAVGDATGHGISGAILAGIFSATIQNIFHRYPTKSPQLLLRTLLRTVQQTLLHSEQQGGTDALREGADLAIGIADFQHKKLYFGLAGRPVWLFSSEGLRILEGGRRGIDKYTSLDYEFPAYEEFLNERDSIFLFTDGVSDAISPEGKRLGVKTLRMQMEAADFLESTAAEQRDKLVALLHQWRGGTSPNDDVTMVILPVWSLYEYVKGRLSLSV